MFVGVAFTAVIFLLIALRNLRWAVFAVAALLPTYLIRFSVGPLPTTVLEMLLLVTIAVWLVKHRGYAQDDPRLAPWRIPITLFLVAGLIGVAVAPDYWKALGLFRAYLLVPAFFFVVATSVLRDRRDVKRIFAALAISAFAISAYAILQRFTGIGIPAPWDVELRVTSFYPFPNAVGLFLAPLIPVFVALAIERRNQKSEIKNQLFWSIAAVFSILAILFSKTEGAWMGVAAALIFLGVVHKKTRAVTAVAVVLLAIAVTLTPQLRDPFVQKITLRDWSGQVRRTQWTESIAMLQDRPIFGAGLSGYPATLRPYHQATYIEIFQYPHNIVLNFWSELGIIGLLAFSWILITFFRLIRKSLTTDNPQLTTTLGLAAGMLVLIIHGLVDVPYFKNDLAVQFWLFAAAVAVIASEAKQSPKLASSPHSSQ